MRTVNVKNDLHALSKMTENFFYGKYISLHIAKYSLICCDNLAWLKSGNHAKIKQSQICVMDESCNFGIEDCLALNCNLKYCRISQEIKWAICKNGLLPNSPKWADSEIIGLRFTESQTPKGTQYTGGWNFFVPDSNKLPYSLRLQRDNIKPTVLFYSIWKTHTVIL